MRRLIFSLVCFLCSFTKSIAIDFVKSYAFSPDSLVGKDIIIPTYNNGDSKLDFVYNISVLNSEKFNYKNYSSLSVLGTPIHVDSYTILNKGKKAEALCYTITKDNQQAVLYFPMFVKNTDFTGKVTADLFYGEPIKQTSSGNYYSIKDMHIPHFKATDVVNFINTHKDSIVYSVIGDERYSYRPYKLNEIKYIQEVDFGSRTNLDTEFRYHVNFGGQIIRSTENKLDNLYAILQNGKVSIYLQINYMDANCGDGDGIDAKDIDKTLLTKSEYARYCSNQYNKEELDKLNRLYTSKEIYIKKDDDKIKGKYVFYSKNKDFSNLKVDHLSYFADNYFDLEGVKQIGLHHHNGQEDYNYYIVGKGIMPFDSTTIYIAFDLTKSTIGSFEDGASHRIQVKKEEEIREKENKERQAEQAKQEKDYLNMLIRKYGRSNANLIIDGEVKIGFTKAMCEEAWGAPESINTTATINGSFEQWVYGLGVYLYFQGNRLVVIQN